MEVPMNRQSSSVGSFWMLLTIISITVLAACSNSSYAADTLGVWNVKQFPHPAKGDGVTNDTQAIQSHIDSAYAHGGGIVFFPSGNYIISSTIILHSKVYLEGVGGSTFGQYPDFDPIYTPTNFKDSLTCKITLTGSSAIDMIQTDTLFYLCGIQNLALVGNRSGSTDTSSTTGRGIYIPDVIDQYRSQAMFRNVIIFNTKGTGFYDGVNQYEVNLSYCMVADCGWNGYTLYGQSCKVEHCGAGNNYQSGFSIPSQGADRFYDVDAWNNNIGYELHDCWDVPFFGITANNNRTFGVYIGPGNATNSYAPAYIYFYRGNFTDNSTASSGTYSDIYLYGNSHTSGIGPAAVLFDGCRFMGYQGQGHPKYPIEDESQTPQSNSVEHCYFNIQNYTSGLIINRSNMYQVRDCQYEDANGLGPYATNTMRFIFKDTAYQMEPYDGQVNASAQSGNITITLPNIDSVQLGTVYYVSRADNTTNTLTVTAYGTQKINGASSVSVNGYLTTLMITNAGSQWTASKMVAP